MGSKQERRLSNSGQVKSQHQCPWYLTQADNTGWTLSFALCWPQSWTEKMSLLLSEHGICTLLGNLGCFHYPLRLMVVLESASSVFSPWSNKRLKNLGLQGWGILCEQVKHGPSPEEEPVNLTQTCLPSLSNPWPQPGSPGPAPLSSLFEVSHVPVHSLVLFELALRLLLFLNLAYCMHCFAVALLWKVTGSPDNQLEFWSPPLFMPPTHSWVVQAVTHPRAVCQAPCKHCAEDIILFKSHNSPQEVIIVNYI